MKVKCVVLSLWCSLWFCFSPKNVKNKRLLRARLLGFLRGISCILCQLQSHYHSWIRCKLLKKLHMSWWVQYGLSFTGFLHLELPQWTSSLRSSLKPLEWHLLAMWPHWLLRKDLPKNSDIQLMTIRLVCPSPSPHLSIATISFWPVLPDTENVELMKKYSSPKCITRMDSTNQNKNL